VAATSIRSRRGECQLRFGQSVRLPGGGWGRVVGFYRTETPTVVVALSGGATREVLLDELRDVDRLVIGRH
jgi:hypothetical protein